MKGGIKGRSRVKKLDYPVTSCCLGQSSCLNYDRQKEGISPFKEMKTETEKIAFCHGCLSERWRITNKYQIRV